MFMKIPDLVIFFIPLISSFFLTFLFTFVFKKLALKFGFLSQDRGVPYTGGVAFSLSFMFCFLLFVFIKEIRISFSIIWILIFSLIILITEFIDDLWDFSLKSRVIIQISFVLLYLIYGKGIQIYFLPSWLNYLFSILWVMAMINIFNLLDVADGLCGGVSLIISLAFFLIAAKSLSLLTFLFLILSGSLFAFLLSNLPPAKVFMGNSGSHFLGFIFGALSMHIDYAGRDNPLALVVPLLIFATPIIDTGFLIVVRIRKKISPLKKSKDHIYLRLISRNHSQIKSLGLFYFLTFLWVSSGVFLALKFYLIAFILILFSLFATGLLIRSSIASLARN